MPAQRQRPSFFGRRFFNARPGRFRLFFSFDFCLINPPMPTPATIALQGYEGSYHELAARQFFGTGPALLPCPSFGEVVSKLLSGAAEAALMGIENSLVGTIIGNYALLEQAAVRIVGEVYLPIRHQLLARPGTRLTDVRAVHSHPMALRQCAGFLGRYPQWQLVETADTGRSAQELAQALAPERAPASKVAVVAGAHAARLFGLVVLAPDIHDQEPNYTRFLVLERGSPGLDLPAGADKASLFFRAPHTPGSLARVLGLLAAHGLNLSKLESVPQPGQPWHYGFHVDVEFAQPAQLTAALRELPGLTQLLRVLGVYRRGGLGNAEELESSSQNQTVSNETTKCC